jgi:hypothetical protein
MIQYDAFQIAEQEQIGGSEELSDADWLDAWV